jgi:hypothetical protein
MNDLVHVAAGAKIFSKIYHHQIPMHPDDICKTAITTPSGLYEYNRMPFVSGMPATPFNGKLTGRALSFCFAYQDDLELASKDE